MEFKDYLQQQGLAISTLSQYQKESLAYLNYLKNKGKNIYQSDKSVLLEYLSHIKKTRNLQSSTIQKRLQSLDHLHQYLQAQHILADNPCKSIAIRGAKPQRLHQIFGAEELDKLSDSYYYYSQEIAENLEKLPAGKGANSATKDNHLRYRTYRNVVLNLVIYQALSVNEIGKLTAECFDLRQGVVHIEKTRKTNARTLRLEASQMGELMRYLHDPIDPPNYPDVLVRQLGKLNPKFKNLQQLRASRITLWVKVEGLRKAQYLAGHKYISSTECYIDRGAEELKKELDEYHPLG